MADLSAWKRPDPSWLAPVRERSDGLRVHLGGFIAWPDGSQWSFFRFDDSGDPLWRRARMMEPNWRRALMLFADLKCPISPTLSKSEPVHH